jgi:hypothetical protein
LQRPVDLPHQPLPGQLVAGDGPLGKQVVGLHRARGVRPGRGGEQPRHSGRRALAGGEQVRDGRPDHHGAGSELGDQQSGRANRVDVAAEDRDQPVALHAGEDVEVGRPGHPPDLVDDRFRFGIRRVPDHDDHRVVAAPAQGGRPGPQRVVGLAAQQGVDHEGLQPGVPGAAGLGCLGVDLGRREGDLA